MGWLWTHKPRHIKASDYLINHSGALRWSDSPYDYKVLDSAIVNLKTFYAAVEQVERATGARQVWAAVFLLGYAPKDEHNFGWKDMDETCGPCEAACPERILDLLTPTDSEYALDWRKRCRAAIAERKDRPKIVPGCTLNLYGRPYTVGQARADKKGFTIRNPEGATFYASHARLRLATDIKEPA